MGRWFEMLLTFHQEQIYSNGSKYTQHRNWSWQDRHQIYNLVWNMKQNTQSCLKYEAKYTILSEIWSKIHNLVWNMKQNTQSSLKYEPIHCTISYYAHFNNVYFTFLSSSQSVRHDIHSLPLIRYQGPSWSWSYGSLIYNYLMQSVPITTKFVISNTAHGEVYSIQHYVIKFVRVLWQVGGFLQVHRFHQQ